MAACASSSWPLPTYPANPWDQTQNLTETVLFSGAKGSGSPGNIIRPLTEQLPCAGTLLVLLTCWVLIFPNLPLSLPPFYRLTLVGLRLLQKHQTWVSDVPAWPNLIQVRDCNHRAPYSSAWTLATAPCLPSPPLPLLLRTLGTASHPPPQAHILRKTLLLSPLSLGWAPHLLPARPV